uniref:ATP synthase complex subunit 8 n=1 Tax=Megophrys carinense TaxID=2783809 RepID=S4V124_MEGCA|nr:ATP synthase F0 subunit 8 [Megophrys carinense]
MPQLNPAPWFMILITSWLIFLTLLTPKIKSFKFFENPTSPPLQIQNHHWPWLWV